MIRVILIVDDPNSARDIQNRLQRVSYDVTAMRATADEVITRADELRPDVILMDVRLKGETDGVEVAQQIKSFHDIPIIFITANADQATVRRAIAAEPDGFLIMPLDELELQAAIEMAIHRHGMEAKARESDRRIRELTESLSEVIFETDMAGNITFVNQAGLKEFGYTKEQVEGGMTLYDFIPPDKQEEIRESIAQAIIDEPSEWIEVQGLRRDGSTFPVSVRASLIVREGVPVGIRGIALNVTEQKRAEQQREDNERQLRELTDSLPEIVFETDVGGTFTFVNPMGLDSLGYTEADLKKQLTIEDLIIPADHARARENFRKRLGGTAAVWAEYTVQRKDGSTFALSIRTTAVIRDGVVVGARGIAIDITERKRLEEELQIAASFPSENPDPVLRLSGDGALLYANDAGRKVLGECPDNLDTVGGPMLALLRDAATDALKANAIRQIEVDVADHTLEFSVAPIVERQHVNFYGVDITARKHAEELAREHARSMEIVNQIAAAGNRATSVESFAETVTTLTLELMHLDVGALYLVDDDARCANLQYVRGVPETTMDAIKTISLDDTLCAAFCVEGRAPHIEDRDESCVLCAAVMGLASHARAPLYHHDVCIGELHVGSLTRHAFSQAEKELLTAVGNEVGTVIAKLQADDALKESELRFRALFESSPIVQLRYDVDGHPGYVNRAALEFLGIADVADIQHISIFSSPRVSEANMAQLRAGHAIRYEQRYDFDEIKKRGDFPTTRSGVRFVDFHIAPLSNVGTGKVEGYIGQIDDITERKRADQKLRESEKRIREITDALPVVVYEADETGRITFANATTSEMFGYTKEELEAGMSIIQLVTDADKERARTVFRRRTSRDDVGRIEYTGLRKDGSTFPVSALGAPIMRDGANVGVRGVAVDITERERDEQKLRESEKRIREITDALPVVVYEADETGRITFANATTSEMFGYTKEELEAGMSIIQLIAPTDRERAGTVFHRRVGREDVGRIEYAGLRKDGGMFPISIRAVIMGRDGAVVGMRGIIVDITERKRAEERAREHTHTIEILNRIITEGNRAASVESFAETVTNLTLELMHFDGGTIHLGDDDARFASLRYATGIPDTAVEAIRRIPLDEAPYAGFLVEPKPLFLDGQEVSRVPHVAELGHKSLAVVPLYLYGKVIGTLNVGSFKRHTFSQAEKELLIAIGNEVGVVIAKLHADDALKESEKRIREITDALPVVVYEADETGRITFANATTSEMFGYTKEELEAGMSIIQLIAPTDRERAGTVFHRRVGREDVGRIEYAGLRKDGGMFPISIRAVIMGRDGAVVGMRGIIVDITEQKKTEQALARESAINSAIARLFTPLIAPMSTLEDVALAILDEAKHLTGSEAGFVGLIDAANRDMIGFGLTQMMPEECAIPEEKRQIRFPIGPDGSYPALWGRALNTKKGFCTNAPATHPASRGTPDGHTPLAQLLAVPALVGDHVEGEIMLANPARDYTEHDLMAVERLADVYALAVIRTQAEDAIKAALDERGILLKEIHHRVKNNMQIISSFLNLQAAQAKEPETVDMLTESQSRIRSMALIHEQLYRSSSLADIDFAEYVESLTNALLRMYNVAEGEIAINTDIENVQLGVDAAIPCALIVNELVSNCLKHAFTDRKTGEATIAFHRINGTYELTVADNGVGLPPDLDFREINTLGLQLVTGLVNQLDGTITLDRTKGTTFIITFKPEGASVVRSGGK